MKITYTDKIEMFDNKIYIADKMSSKLVVFDTTGKAIDIISKFRDDQHSQMELETFLNTYKNNLMTDFRQEFPQLKEADYQLFLYYPLGLSSSTIGIFLQEKPSVIYNRKKRLKDKIQHSESAKKELFLSIFDRLKYLLSDIYKQNTIGYL